MLFCELVVTADTREKDVKRVSALQDFVELHGGVFEKVGLPNKGGCDYRVQGWYKDREINLGVEYKTLVDFSGSYKQLGSRFRNAYEYYDSVALFIEVNKYSFGVDGDGFHGTIQNNAVRDGSADVLKYFTFQGVLQSIARSGVYVVRVQSPIEFPYALGWMVNYIANPIHNMMDWEEKDYLHQYLNSLSKIPSVGIRTAEKIAGRYQRYSELTEASHASLKGLLGDRIGNSVYEFLHGESGDWKPTNTTNLPDLGDLIVDYIEGVKQAAYDEIMKEFSDNYSVDQIHKVLLDLSSKQVGTGRTQQLKQTFVGDTTVFEVI